jgi:hypothetical protein
MGLRRAGLAIPGPLIHTPVFLRPRPLVQPCWPRGCLLCLRHVRVRGGREYARPVLACGAYACRCRCQAVGASCTYAPRPTSYVRTGALTTGYMMHWDVPLNAVERPAMPVRAFPAHHSVMASVHLLAGLLAQHQYLIKYELPSISYVEEQDVVCRASNIQSRTTAPI